MIHQDRPDGVAYGGRPLPEQGAALRLAEQATGHAWTLAQIARRVDAHRAAFRAAAHDLAQETVGAVTPEERG